MPYCSSVRLVDSVGFIQNKAKIAAVQFEKSMAGIGADHNALIRSVILHREDIEAIKKEYQDIFQESLRERIKKETSGDYKALMTRLIGK
jgi:annexin A7/11